MSQITIYLAEELVKEMRARAKDEGVSQSQWIARLIEERLTRSWPASVAALAGAWSDFPEAKMLRPSHSEDVPRESL